MKNIHKIDIIIKLGLVILLIFMYPQLASTQQLVINKTDLKVLRQEQPFDHRINLSIKNVAINKKVHIKLTDNNLGTALRGIDYSFDPQNNSFDMIDNKHISITINPNINQKKAVTVIFTLDATLGNIAFPSQTDTLIISKIEIEKDIHASNKKVGYKIDSAELKLLTAGSLNFFGNQQFKKYVGQLDIRIPNLSGNRRWGINAGVFTKDYYTDSVSTGRGQFNVRKLNDTSNYASKSYNRYAKVEYAVFGAYANPTFLLTNKSNENLRIYMDASFEVLATSRKTSFNNYRLIDSVDHAYNENIKRDDVLDPNSPRIMPKATSTINYITGYFGAGPQLIYQQNNLFHFNLLSFVGYSITSYENVSNVPNSFNYSFANKKFYYFFKGVLTEKLTKLNGTIGVEVRGFFPNNTGIAAYLGFLITPSDLFKSK